MNQNPKKQKRSLLISGTSSGLGRHLFEFFGGTPYTRETSEEEIKSLKKSGVDVIIHAAFNSTWPVNSNNLYSYINDNILLTKKILNTPHKKFIFISSVDAYPKDGKKYTENEVIDINLVDGIYAITKLISESLIKEISPNYLILRCSTLLGKYSRKNSLIKIMQDINPTLSLSAESTFNYILHSDISEFVKVALKEGLQGIYNLASSENITLSQIADLFKKKVTFGSHIYNVGNIDNSKAASIFPSFKKDSKEAIMQHIKILK